MAPVTGSVRTPVVWIVPKSGPWAAILPKILGAVTLLSPCAARTVTSPSGPVLVMDWAMNWLEKIDPPSP